MKTSVRILFWEGLVLTLFAVLMLVFFDFMTIWELLFPIVFGGVGLLGLVVALVLFIYGEAVKARPAWAKQTTKFAANAVVYSVIVFAILVFLNLMGGRHTKEFDMTSAKVNTLSDQTVTVLKNLPEGAEIKIVGFFKAGESKRFEPLAKKYAELDSRVKVETVDPDLYPEKAAPFGIQQANAVAIACQTPENAPPSARCTGQPHITLDVTETGLTTGIVKVSAPHAGTVYFLEGHGEVPLDGNDERGYGLLKKGLANENIDLKTFTFLSAGKVPDDARVIVIAGPTKKLPPEEVAQLDQYVEAGGRLFIMLDPLVETGLEALLANYGVTVQNDIILDYLHLEQGSVLGLDPLVQDYGAHAITEKIGENLTLFHQSRSFVIDTKDRPGVTASPLLRTSAQSWGETDLSFMQKKGGTPTRDEKTDHVGPLTLGAAIEKPIGQGESRKDARLVVIGDADFANNRWALVSPYNADLFLNSLNWLSGQEAYISVRPNSFAPDVFTMTANDTALIFFASVFLLPQLVVMLGIGVAIRRRG